MERYFTSPHLVDCILAFTVVEAVVLIWLRPRLAAHVRLIAIVVLLLPGVFLMLALRAALDGAAWPWVPAALLAALVAHVADIRERWRG